MDSPYNAMIQELTFLTSRLMRLRVVPDFPIPAYRAGQFFTLGLLGQELRVEGFLEDPLPEERKNKLIRRAYSVAHPMLDEKKQLYASPPPYLEFSISLADQTPDAPPPALTPRLFARRFKEGIFLSEKAMGHYTLDLAEGARNYLFLSTGTGEAPHTAMVHELLQRNTSARIVVISCARTRPELAYHQEFRLLASRYENLKYFGFSTRDLPVGATKLHLQDLLEPRTFQEKFGFELNPETHVYLCGSPSMIGAPKKLRDGSIEINPQGVCALLKERGFALDFGREKGQVHYESYW